MLIDKTEVSLQLDAPLLEMMWKRQEIENYLLVPDAVLRFCEREIRRVRKISDDERNLDLFSPGDLRKAKELLQRKVLEEVFENPLTDTPFLMGTKVSDVVLEPFFREFYAALGEYNVMPKSNLYRLASVTTQAEIHPEVCEKLNAIATLLAKDTTL
jgi:hypothetical protein